MWHLCSSDYSFCISLFHFRSLFILDKIFVGINIWVRSFYILSFCFACSYFQCEYLCVHVWVFVLCIVISIVRISRVCLYRLCFRQVSGIAFRWLWDDHEWIIVQYIIDTDCVCNVNDCVGRRKSRSSIHWSMYFLCTERNV